MNVTMKNLLVKSRVRCVLISSGMGVLVMEAWVGDWPKKESLWFNPTFQEKFLVESNVVEWR